MSAAWNDLHDTLAERFERSPPDTAHLQARLDAAIAAGTATVSEYDEPPQQPYDATEAATSTAATSAPAVDAADEYADDTYEMPDDQPDAESAPVSMPASSRSSGATHQPSRTSTAAPSLAPSGSTTTLHSSYLQHIRNLQKTNAALQKKNEYLAALQNDSTRVKLIKKLQRLLREKQMMVDEMADLIITKHQTMTADALSRHLEDLIEQGALDQVNPAKAKKEIMDARKENARLLADLREAKRQIRNLETASAANPASGTTSALPSRPATARKRESAAQIAAASAATAAAAQSQAHLDAERQAKTDQLAREFVELSQAHTALQSSHQTLVLSLSEHKRLLETITGENRALRGYLAQWESSEERRVQAEQTITAMQAEKQRWVAEQETVYQEVRAIKSKMQQLALSKAEVVDAYQKRLAAAQAKQDEAKDHAIHLTTQLQLLRNDLRAAHEMAQYERESRLIHLSPQEQESLTRQSAKHAEEVATLEREIDMWKRKCALAIDQSLAPDAVKQAASKLDDVAEEKKEDALHQAKKPLPSTSAAYAALLLRENTRLHATVAALEQRLSSSLIETTNLTAEQKQKKSEMLVLQSALQAMAKDLQTTQSNLSALESSHKSNDEREALLKQLLEVKIPKLKTQRANLVQACQRQNVTIQELNKEIEALAKEKATGWRHSSAGSSSTPSRVVSPTPAKSSNHSSSSKLTNPSSSSKHQQHHSIASTPTRNSASTVSRAASALDFAAAVASDTVTTMLASSASALSTSAARPFDQQPLPSHADRHAQAEAGARDVSTAVAPVAAEPSAPVATADADEWYDPSGTWTRYPTEDGAAFFFYNHVTQESVWTDPLAVGGEAAVASHSDGTAESTIRSVRDSELDLTPLATERFDDLSARPQASAAALSAAEVDEYALDDDEVF